MNRTALIALTLSAGTALGSTGTLVDTHTLEFGMEGTTTPDFMQALTFNQFDGELVCVEIEIVLEVAGGSALADNDSDTQTTVDIVFGTTGGISSTDVTLLDAAFDPVVSEVAVINQVIGQSLEPNDGDPTDEANSDGGSDEFELAGIEGSDSDSGEINDMFLDEFEGNGTFDILVNADLEFSVSGGSGVSGEFTPQFANGTVTIRYYVPTPGAAAVLGLGGLVAARRRR